MLLPSGNAKVSFRSRAYFFLDPTAIVEFGNELVEMRLMRVGADIKKTLANFHTLFRLPTSQNPRSAYCVHPTSLYKLVQVVTSLV
jgi:hypothetical protein